MPTSITFSGNNTNYTGTLYLHPLIDHITFTNKDAVINNINFPNSIPNTGSDKDTVPFIKSNKPRTLTINIPFNIDNSFDAIDKLTIPGNTTINLSNIEKTKQYKFQNKNKNKPLNIFFNSKTEQSSDLKILNISNKEYALVEYVEQTFFIPDDNTIAARFDYSIGEKGTCLYYYPKNINCSCGELLSLQTIKPTKELFSNEIIIQYLESNRCNACSNIINKNSINPTLVSYLYPKTIDYIWDTTNGCNLYCSICSNKELTGFLKSSFDFSENKFLALFDYNNNGLSGHTLNNCTLLSNDNLKYDYDYILKQLNIGYKKRLLQEECN